VLLARRIEESRKLATFAERIRSLDKLPRTLEKELTDDKVDALYETAFLRVCYAWEWFIEESFIDCICKNPSIPHQGTLIHPAFKRRYDAEAALLDGRPYISWSNQDHSIRTMQRFVDQGIHTRVILSYKSKLNAYFQVRHHIAHDSKSSVIGFQQATMELASMRYSESVGRFLRDRNRSSKFPTKWFDYICDDLISLSKQIDPR